MIEFEKSRRVLSFYLTEGFLLQAFSSGLSALQHTNEILAEKVYEWRIVTPDGRAAISNCGLPISPTSSLELERGLLAANERPSMIVVCGGDKMTGGSRELINWLRECRLHRIPLAALGGATSIVATAGLLRGRRCAVHWEQFPAFTERFPDVVAVQSLYEADSGFFSCAGDMAAFDMFLHIVSSDFGNMVAGKACEKAISDRPRAKSERQRWPLQTRFGGVHPQLVKVIEQMEANLSEPLRMLEFVPANGLCRRQIERLFYQEFGRSPARYFLEARLEKADLLLQHSTLFIADVAIACGFVSASHFSKAYKEVYCMTPQQKRLDTLTKRRPNASDLVGGRDIVKSA